MARLDLKLALLLAFGVVACGDRASRPGSGARVVAGAAGTSGTSGGGAPIAGGSAAGGAGAFGGIAGGDGGAGMAGSSPQGGNVFGEPPSVCAEDTCARNASCNAFDCKAERYRLTLEGVGLLIRATDKSYEYKDDHLDTTSFDGGSIFPSDPVPAPATASMEFATYDFRPASQDVRTNESIERLKANQARNILIALPSATASDGDWRRVTQGASQDFYLTSASRDGSRRDDTSKPYWFYERQYTLPDSWVTLPSYDGSSGLPPFVFANDGELYWQNPPVIPTTKVSETTITIAGNPESVGVVNPNFVVTQSGDYLASVSGGDCRGTGVWRSKDKGATWQLLKDGFDLNRYSLFEHSGSLFLLGQVRGQVETVIYASNDDGETWSTKSWAGYGGEDAPSHVLTLGGRVWKAALAGDGPGFYSAPVAADLTQQSSWTLSSPGPSWGGRFGSEVTLQNGQRFEVGNEGTLLASKEGKLYNLGRDRVYKDGAWSPGITSVQPDMTDLSRTTYDVDYAGPKLPGNENGKATAIYDPTTDRYFALTSGPNRITLDLYVAEGRDGHIGDFELVKTVLMGHSATHGFNYPVIQIDGDDIVFVSRTAWDTHRGSATRWHNGNVFTFHRLRNYKALIP